MFFLFLFSFHIEEREREKKKFVHFWLMREIEEIENEIQFDEKNAKLGNVENDASHH